MLHDAHTAAADPFDASDVETPEADAAEQRQTAWNMDETQEPVDSPEHSPEFGGITPAPPTSFGESAPADVLDQSREVVLDDEER
jgi:hypothetical protein